MFLQYTVFTTKDMLSFGLKFLANWDGTLYLIDVGKKVSLGVP